MSVLHRTVQTVTPFEDRSRPRRLLKIALWLVGLVVLLAICRLLGFDVVGWFVNVWDTITEISLGYIVAGVTFQTIQTTLAAFAWYSILAAGYPDGGVSYRNILAAYAAGTAMNGFLPASLGTFAYLLMFVALIRGATFAGILGGTLVQKIFYTAIGTLVYVYLFVTVPGSFDLELGGIIDHYVLLLAIVAGGVFLIVILVRIFLVKFKSLWEKAKQGGAILSTPRKYVFKVLLPSFGAWVARLVVVGIFLAAYSIPVTFHTIMSVIGGNSISSTLSFTPGGVGVTQAVNNISLCERHRPCDRDGVLARPAAHHHSLERCLRDRGRHLGLRLDGRQAARRRLLLRRQGEGGGAVGRPQGSQGREEGSEAIEAGREARRATTSLMCRWLAYSGSPMLLEELLYKPVHSLIDQSLHSRLGATTTNGDGFGVGWYGAVPTPAVFHSTEPAWNDRNLRELAGHISSPLVFAHIRASTGTAVQETNCHPFRHGSRLWMHNGAIREFPRVKRDLAFAVDPSLYPSDRRLDRLRAVLLPRSHVRPRGRSAARRRARRRSDRGNRRPPRRRASDPDDGGDDRRRADLGLSLLERGQLEIALLQHRRADTARALSRERPVSGKSPTRRGSSSRSRSVTWRECGMRFPRRATESSSRARTSSIRSCRCRLRSSATRRPAARRQLQWWNPAAFVLSRTGAG